MSEISTVAATDWNVVAAAAATFVTTAGLAIAGWFKGKKKIEGQLGDATSAPQVSSVIVQDNQSVRDATLAQLALRDQVFLLNTQLPLHTEALRENNRSLEDICEELKTLVKILKERG